MHRASSGKRIELTARDIELFKLLYRYQYLRSDFLYAFVGGKSQVRFKERLGHLYHDGRYIDRPEQQWQFAKCRSMPPVYELDVRGEQVLRDHGLAVHSSPLLTRGRMGVARQFAHQLMICDCLASIELGVRHNTALRFISWQEILAKAPERTCTKENPFAIPITISHTRPGSSVTHSADVKAVPDGLFGLEYDRDGQKLYRFFALEADRNTMPVKRANLEKTSYLRKVLAYRQIITQDIHRSHLGLPNLLVLTVTTNEQHMKNIMAAVKEVANEGKSSLFLFKTMSSLGDFQKAPAPAPHVLTEPWQRVGLEALTIDQA
jgi:Replication-relaxation